MTTVCESLALDHSVTTLCENSYLMTTALTLTQEIMAKLIMWCCSNLSGRSSLFSENYRGLCLLSWI